MKKGVIFLLMFLLAVFSVSAIYCGDGELDEGEICDVGKLSHYTCLNFSYDISECTEINKTVDLNSTGEINETIELNLTEENLTETLDLEDLNVDNEVVDVPSGVVGVASSESKVITLGVWLIIIISLLVIGVFFIWLYIFKLKK